MLWRDRVTLFVNLLLAMKSSSAGPETETIGLASTTYQAIEGHALLGHAFLDAPGISAVKCLALCLSQRGRCRSINYDRVNTVCQMNNAAKGEFMTEFRQDVNLTYFQKNNIVTGTRCSKVRFRRQKTRDN